MDKMKAMDKVKKLLALANDKGATEAEAAIALKKAKDLAETYGIRIFQTSNNTSTVKNADTVQTYYCWYAKPAYSEIIRTMNAVMNKAGFRCYTISSGRKVVGIRFYAKDGLLKSDPDFMKKLDKLYKQLCKHCDSYKKAMKADYTSRYEARWAMENWQHMMLVNLNYTSEYFNYAGKDSIYNEFTNLRKEVA